MNGNGIARIGALLIAVAGCGPSALEEPPSIGRDGHAPVVEAPGSGVDVSWVTPRDERFAAFLRANSGGMIAKAAVGIDRNGQLRVVLDRSVAPEDTLDLTKSLMAGARKDFPDRAFTLAVFDPSEQPILKAHYEPGQGVRYELAQGGGPAPGGGAAGDSGGTGAPGAPERSGTTGRDREFADWAMRTGKDYLRYVQADLERNGRLWFGVTRAVAPGDVPDLTRSLLRGAREEFPRRELVATVFDPEGERIGRAILGRDGDVRWER